MTRLRDLAFLASALALPGAVQAGKADVYALVGGKAVTVSGSAIENATIVIRDGVIEDRRRRLMRKGQRL